MVLITQRLIGTSLNQITCITPFNYDINYILRKSHELTHLIMTLTICCGYFNFVGK